MTLTKITEELYARGDELCFGALTRPAWKARLVCKSPKRVQMLCEPLAGTKADTTIGMLEYINDSLRSVAASVGDSVVVTPLENFKEQGTCCEDSWVYGFGSPMVFHLNAHRHAVIEEAAYSEYKS